jgi:outer membrane lipoprotein SlyB
MQKIHIIVAALVAVTLLGCTGTPNSSTAQTATNQEATTGVRVNATSKIECEQQGANWIDGRCEI